MQALSADGSVLGSRQEKKSREQEEEDGNERSLRLNQKKTTDEVRYLRKVLS